MADQVNGARSLTRDTTTGVGGQDRAGLLGEVELIPGGMGWLVERSAERGRVWTEWPLPPRTVIRLRSAEGAIEDGTAQILRSELIEVRQGRPPLYEGVLLFSLPGPLASEPAAQGGNQLLSGKAGVAHEVGESGIGKGSTHCKT